MDRASLLSSIESLAEHFICGEILAAQTLMADTMAQLNSFIQSNQNSQLLGLLPIIEQSYTTQDYAFLADILNYEVSPLVKQGR